MLDAQRNLESALDKTNALLRLSTERDAGRASETITEARKLRRSAVRRYVVALGRFTSLVVCGKMPRERKAKPQESCFLHAAASEDTRSKPERLTGDNG